MVSALQHRGAKCYSALITLSFDPTVVVLDMTNSNYLNATNVTTQNVSGINYTNGITFEVEPISSTIVRFYKNNVSQNYTYPITNNRYLPIGIFLIAKKIVNMYKNKFIITQTI